MSQPLMAKRGDSSRCRSKFRTECSESLQLKGGTHVLHRLTQPNSDSGVCRNVLHLFI